MKEPQRVIISFLLSCTVVIAVLYYISIIRNNRMIFYYGEYCPHCRNVEKFIEDNKVDTKLTIEKKEVTLNDQNRSEMLRKARICGLKNGRLNIPMLFEKKKCYIGDQEIIGYLGERTSK